MERNKGKRLVKYVPDYVVFDLETTGIHPVSDAIIEISAIKVKNGAALEFSTLVHPGRKIPPAATAVNGITDAMVEDAPELYEAMAAFGKFIEGEILVGHNIHSFDMKFIYQAAGELNLPGFENDYLDTLYMARSYLPQLAHHRLTDIAAYFQIDTHGAHRALNDCIMNQKCYEELGRLQSAAGISVCPKCGGELFKRRGRFGEFYGCSNYPGCRFTRNIK